MIKNRDRFQALQKRLSDPALTGLAVLLAILMFVVAPLQAVGVLGAHHFAMAVALVLVAGTFIVSGSAVAVTAMLTAIALVVAATTMRLRQPSFVDLYLDAIAWMIAGVTLNIVIARAVFAPGRVNLHRIVGAILLYLVIGFTFVAMYCFVALMVPDAFTGLKPLADNLGVASNFGYFSFVTLTSVGYGDIVPVHPFARGLANIEAIIGQLYPATLLARLVTLAGTEQR
ncbi:MAG TPA: ion channel [Pseudolabrys sp.]|nr:ion channel [Pseudolabrys sp.]